jgi:hypothetical protein
MSLSEVWHHEKFLRGGIPFVYASGSGFSVVEKAVGGGAGGAPAAFMQQINQTYNRRYCYGLPCSSFVRI